MHSASGIHYRTLTQLLFLLVIALLGTSIAEAAYNFADLDEYWKKWTAESNAYLRKQGRAASFSPQSLLAPGAFDVLAKAEPDECYFGIGDSRNDFLYPDDYYKQNCEGILKTNQAYVWGLARSDETVFFGTAPNVHCLVLDSFFPGEPTPYETDSWVCEFGANNPQRDFRPSRLFAFDLESEVLHDLTPAVIGAPTGGLLFDTVGIRSAGSKGDLVLMAGPSFTAGINVFAFNAETKAFLGAANLPEFNNIRQWLNVKRELYVGVGKGSAGAVLRWTGDVDDPFSYVVVGDIGGDAAFLAQHGKHIMVTTWGGSGGGELWMSPPLHAGKLDAIHAAGWTKVWALSQYEAEPAAMSVCGAVASYGGWVYWGTMHVPGLGAATFSLIHPNAGDDAKEGALLGTFRSISIFRGRDFGTKKQVIEVLYGYASMPRYNAELDKWEIVSNRMGQRPKFGPAGFGNPFNNYTWIAAVSGKDLYFGTMDFSYLVGGFLGEAVEKLPEAIQNLAGKLYGADLWRFPLPGLPAFPVTLSGGGNNTNYGFRTVLPLDDGLLLGSANPMNLHPGGGWELIKYKR